MIKTPALPSSSWVRWRDDQLLVFVIGGSTQWKGRWERACFEPLNQSINQSMKNQISQQCYLHLCCLYTMLLLIVSHKSFSMQELFLTMLTIIVWCGVQMSWSGARKTSPLLQSLSTAPPSQRSQVSS